MYRKNAFIPLFHYFVPFIDGTTIAFMCGIAHLRTVNASENKQMTFIRKIDGPRKFRITRKLELGWIT